MLLEAEVQDRVKNDETIRNGLLNICNLSQDFSLKPEDEYINGITADFTIIDNNKIKGIIECKGGQINVTDYVRGIGQLFQYEYFKEINVPHLSLKYDEDFKSIFLFPSTVLRQNTFNVARFKYPKTIKILEFNEISNAIRQITDSELSVLSQVENNNLISISQYYFRDNRVFEYYILLLYLLYLSNKGITQNNRRELEQNLSKLSVINNGNWRNAFITLSGLGLIDNKNSLTLAGKQIAILPYSEFAYIMYSAYMKPYFDEILESFSKEIETISNDEISNKIKKRYSCRDVLYLTQSNNRYISSWLNIMRDDYGIIKFDSRSSKRRVIYKPNELNKSAFIEKITENSIAKEYIINFQNLLQRNEL